MKVRMRIGFRTNFFFGLFPNAGIAVVYVKQTDVEKFLEEAERFRFLLIANNLQAVADRFVCETSD